MSFYAALFWWLIGLLSGIGLSAAFVAVGWAELLRRGDVAIKDKQGVWRGKNLPMSFDDFEAINRAYNEAVWSKFNR
jgi:hypothetical protein